MKQANRPCLWLLLVAIVITNGTSCNKNVETPGMQVKESDKYPLLMLINPHINARHQIEINGKKYSNVRGGSKYWIGIPEIQSILFIVDEQDYSVSYYIINTHTGKEIHISGKHSLFGNTIGNQDTIDRIDSVTNSVIVAETLFKDMSVKYYLDLDAKTVKETTVRF